MAELTVDALMRLAAQFRPIPRLIVGMPLVKEGEVWKRESDGMLFLGRGAWQALLKVAGPITTLLPTETLSGMRVEFFGDRPDHYAILREVLEAMARGALLRIAIDQEFGDTNPTLALP